MDVDQFDTASMDIQSVYFQQSTDDNLTVHQRFINALNNLDYRVEKLRKESISLTEKRDVLLMSMDILKHNELLNGLNEYELEEINCYAQRISNRLSTVDISVKTVRDNAQEDALHQVNSLIDSLLTVGDRLMARQRCQTSLNACSVHDAPGSTSDVQQIVDKKFETAVLGCTLDDQKIIKKRLQALMTYLNTGTGTTGVLGMQGNFKVVNEQSEIIQWIIDGGVGITPEGINQNYVMYEFALERGWYQKPTDVMGWINNYTFSRYGFNDNHIESSWKLLKDTVFSYVGPSHHGKYVVCRRPSINIFPWTWYNLTQFDDVLDEFLNLVELRKVRDTFESMLTDMDEMTVMHTRIHRVYRLHSSLITIDCIVNNHY